MLGSIIAFLAMLNPFALFLYLDPVMSELENKEFLKVFFKASVISFLILAIFAVTGEYIFQNILRIHFDSFRIFGGIIIFTFAYLYIVKGQKAMILMRGSIDEIAEEIALPYMVGAGTISVAVLMSQEDSVFISLLGILAVLAVTFVVVVILKSLKDNLRKKDMKATFDHIMTILLRLNGFFLGAIGVNMILVGIKRVFL